MRQNKSHGHHLSSIDSNELNDLIKSDPQQTIQEISQTLNVHFSTVSRLLEIIGKGRKLDKWVLTNSSMKTKHSIWKCALLLLRSKEERFLQQIVTMNKKWIFYDNHTHTLWWLGVKNAPGRDSKGTFASKDNDIYCMMVFCWFICYSFFPQGETINAA